MSEAMKIFPVIEKYLGEKVWDVGCGDKKIREDAKGIDSRKLSCIDYPIDLNHGLAGLGGLKISHTDWPDTIFSSHLLEHVVDPGRLIFDFSIYLKESKLLVLYLPDAKHYNNRGNAEHLHSFEYEVFKRWFEKRFKFKFKLLDHGHDWDNPDHYSFYIVARRIL